MQEHLNVTTGRRGRRPLQINVRSTFGRGGVSPPAWERCCLRLPCVKGAVEPKARLRDCRKLETFKKQSLTASRSSLYTREPNNAPMLRPYNDVAITPIVKYQSHNSKIFSKNLEIRRKICYNIPVLIKSGGGTGPVKPDNHLA